MEVVNGTINRNLPTLCIWVNGLLLLTCCYQPNLGGVKMKKYALVLTVAALFLIPAITSAADNGWKNFAGVYEMTASGSCIHSENGYDVDSKTGWYAAKAGTVYAGTTVWLGTWAFEHDGTGTYSDTFYATVTPPPSGSVAGGLRIFQDNNVPFTYNITPFGDITIKEVNKPFVEYTGSVSPNKKHMVLVDTPKIKGPAPAPFWYIVCNASRTLIKVND